MTDEALIQEWLAKNVPTVIPRGRKAYGKINTDSWVTNPLSFKDSRKRGTRNSARKRR